MEEFFVTGNLEIVWIVGGKSGGGAVPFNSQCIERDEGIFGLGVERSDAGLEVVAEDVLSGVRDVFVVDICM